MTVCQSRDLDAHLAVLGKRELAELLSLFSQERRGVQGRRRRRPKGAEPWTPRLSCVIAVSHRSAETTDDRGRFDDESR